MRAPLLPVVGALLLAGCTSLGLTAPNLAVDCEANTRALAELTKDMKKIYTVEREAVDAENTVTKGYCSGLLPADQTLASRAVEASTVHIGAIKAIVEMRP